MRVRRPVATTAAAALVAGTVWSAAPAVAASASDLASAVLTPSAAAYLTGSVLTMPDDRTSAVRTDPVAGFPSRTGGTYAVLSTGNAADLTAGNQGFSAASHYEMSTSRGGAYDVTTLELTLDVPQGANCLLGVTFRFLSEEYPDFVGGDFNDAFIAEAGVSTWSVSGSTINAPDNFAVDPTNQVISVNSTLFQQGSAAAEAAGTVFNGATPKLTAQVPLTEGTQQKLFFSVFDQGDGSVDSAVMIDHLRIGTVDDPATECLPGATSNPTEIRVSAAAPTQVDALGTADDTYTIPTSEGITYSVGGTPVAAGTHPGTGTVVVTAQAQAGYTLAGPSQFTLAFTNIVPATPVEPTWHDADGTSSDTYTITATPGVVYSVGGSPVAPGTYRATGTVTVAATAAAGHELTGTAQFSHTFTDLTHVTAIAPTVVDEPGTTLDRVVVPQVTGVTYLIDGAAAAAGTHARTGDVLVTAHAADARHVLVGTSSFPLHLSHADVPGAPSVTDVRADTRRLHVTFAAPASDGGSPVVGYERTLDGGRTWVAVDGSPFELTGLVNGTTSRVQVRAVNAVGTGPASAVATGTPVAAPVTVPGDDGAPARPRVEPGVVHAWSDGAPTPVTVGTQDGRRTVTGPGFGVVLGGVDARGTQVPVDAAGRLVVDPSGFVSVTGSGFAPGEVVDVWLFSTPVLLGSSAVAADGTFAGRLRLPSDVAAGQHTLQLNGTRADGTLVSLAAGLVVAAPADEPDELAATGAPTGSAALLALWLLVAGAGAVLVARRTRRA